MSALPTLQEEVNRKAFETITWLTLAVTQKKITPEQFSTGIDSLFMAVSGLVTDKDFIIIITEAQRLCDAAKTAKPKETVIPEQTEEPADAVVW